MFLFFVYPVPMIVAINKIDKTTSGISQLKQQLQQYGVILEEFGGDTQVVGISALKVRKMSNSSCVPSCWIHC